MSNQGSLLHGIWILAGILIPLTTACGLFGCSRKPQEVLPVVGGDPVFRGAEEGAIPALNDPDLVPAEEAAAFMSDEEPVVGIAPEGERPRAYSTWHLDSHEIVNDQLRSGPLLVTW